MQNKGFGYWAVLEHFETWQNEKNLLVQVQGNDCLLSAETAGKIARDFKVARTFKGVRTLGYKPIANVINEIEISSDYALASRVEGVSAAVGELIELGYSQNPSAVSKLLWFRNPDHWYMYDIMAADAVGAARSSLQGMRGFFTILHACNVNGLNRDIRRIVSDSGVDMCSERIIDKFLWLKGSFEKNNSIHTELKFNKKTAKYRDEFKSKNSSVFKVAELVENILPNGYFNKWGS